MFLGLDLNLQTIKCLNQKLKLNWEHNDYFEITINSIQEVSSIPAANGYMKYTPESGKYGLIEITVKNTSSSLIRFDFTDFQLYDSQNDCGVCRRQRSCFRYEACAEGMPQSGAGLSDLLLI